MQLLYAAHVYRHVETPSLSACEALPFLVGIGPAATHSVNKRLFATGSVFGMQRCVVGHTYSHEPYASRE